MSEIPEAKEVGVKEPMRNRVGMDREGAHSGPDCVATLDIVFRAEARSVDVDRILSGRHEHCQRSR
jgi:hypothetical protein